MVNHYEEFKADLAEFRAMTEKFYKKEIMKRFLMRLLMRRAQPIKENM